jgi:hypothetical protein
MASLTNTCFALSPNPSPFQKQSFILIFLLVFYCGELAAWLHMQRESTGVNDPSCDPNVSTSMILLCWST